jgi:hypothetical protein
MSWCCGSYQAIHLYTNQNTKMLYLHAVVPDQVSTREFKESCTYEPWSIFQLAMPFKIPLLLTHIYKIHVCFIVIDCIFC